jgi:hypothetical protein
MKPTTPVATRSRQRRSAEASVENPSRSSRTPAVPRKKLDKCYLTVHLTRDLIEAVQIYTVVEYRKSRPQDHGLDPRVGGAVERLLRQALKLPQP